MRAGSTARCATCSSGSRRVRETEMAVCHRRVVRFLLLLLAACGSAPPPTPIAPPPAPAKPLPPPAAVSCADAGVILRGTVEDSRKAGPAKEAAIASVCRFDKWSQEILDCVGTEHEPKQCLAKLTTEQRAALDTKLIAWTETYESETWDTAEDEQIASAPPEIPCTSIIGSNVHLIPPIPQQTGEEGSFITTARKVQVIAMCEHWPRVIRACVQEGSINACVNKLDPNTQRELADKLAAIDALMVKIAAAKKKPHDCKAAVAAHYSDAAWRGKAEPAKNPKATRAELAKAATERKQMIADSRKAMLDACTSETWNATLRACELVEGGELCAKGSGRNAVRWGFPAAGIVMRTGIAECDAYGMSIQGLLACDKVPPQAKDALKQGFETMRESLISTATNAESKRLAATSCKQADDAIRQAATSMGCP